METLITYMTQYSVSWFEFILNMSVKGLVILGTAVIITNYWKNSSASVRHLIWCTALISMLILPVISPVVPVWNVSSFSIHVSPDIEISGEIAKASRSTVAARKLIDLPGGKLENDKSGSSIAEYAANPLSYFTLLINRSHWTFWLLTIWLTGSLFVLIRLLFNIAGPLLMVFRAKPAEIQKSPLHGCSFLAVHLFCTGLSMGGSAALRSIASSNDRCCCSDAAACPVRMRSASLQCSLLARANRRLSRSR